MNIDMCPLCASADTRLFTTIRNRRYYVCGNCFGIHVHEDGRLSAEDEKARYLLHHNDIYDQGYRNFVGPIVNAILARQDKRDQGLDFGAGPGPVISSMLREKNFNVQLYDPFFHINTEALTRSYSYIVCCEVIEHFYDPHREFETLWKLLDNGGRLYCMTYLFQEGVQFENWYYKEDPTHVFFYQNSTMRWIRDAFRFSKLEIDNRLIIFQK